MLFLSISNTQHNAYEAVDVQQVFVFFFSLLEKKSGALSINSVPTLYQAQVLSSM